MASFVLGIGVIEAGQALQISSQIQKPTFPQVGHIRFERPQEQEREFMDCFTQTIRLKRPLFKGLIVEWNKLRNVPGLDKKLLFKGQRYVTDLTLKGESIGEKDLEQTGHVLDVLKRFGVRPKQLKILLSCHKGKSFYEGPLSFLLSSAWLKHVKCFTYKAAAGYVKPQVIPEGNIKSKFPFKFFPLPQEANVLLGGLRFLSTDVWSEKSDSGVPARMPRLKSLTLEAGHRYSLNKAEKAEFEFVDNLTLERIVKRTPVLQAFHFSLFGENVLSSMEEFPSSGLLSLGASLKSLAFSLSLDWKRLSTIEMFKGVLRRCKVPLSLLRLDITTPAFYSIASEKMLSLPRSLQHLIIYDSWSGEGAGGAISWKKLKNLISLDLSRSLNRSISFIDMGSKTLEILKGQFRSETLREFSYEFLYYYKAYFDRERIVSFSKYGGEIELLRGLQFPNLKKLSIKYPAPAIFAFKEELSSHFFYLKELIEKNPWERLELVLDTPMYSLQWLGLFFLNNPGKAKPFLQEKLGSFFRCLCSKHWSVTFVPPVPLYVIFELQEDFCGQGFLDKQWLKGSRGKWNMLDTLSAASFEAHYYREIKEKKLWRIENYMDDVTSKIRIQRKKYLVRFQPLA